jgi:hypothetical protein
LGQIPATCFLLPLLLFAALLPMLFAIWMRTGTALFGLLALLLLSSLFLAWWIGKRSFENAYRKGATKGANQEFSVDISEEGIQSADSTDRGQWPRFSNYSESKNPFIIYQADSIHVIVPKRAFDVNDRERSPPHRGEPCALLNPEPRAVTDSIFCLALALGTRKAGRFRVPLCLAEGFTS